MEREFEELVDKAIALLRKNGETVSFAESCTGGLLSATLVARPGISDVYAGAVVAYANHVKESALGIAPSLIRNVGAVSLQVAQAMASGVRKHCETDWAVSITGVAGPGGGTEEKPVGTVCFGVLGPGSDKADQQHFEGDRQAIQLCSVKHALKLLLAEMER